MEKCCIEGCDPASDKDVTYFDFPTSRLLRKRWLEAIGCDKMAGARLCSRHFAPHEYAHVRGRVRLKGKALPTLCLAGGQTPNPSKDPLAAESNAETEESQHSTGSNNDNHNGNVNNDNEKVHNDNEKVHNDNEKVDNDSEKVPSDGEKHSPSRENGHNDKHNHNGKNNDTKKNDVNEENIKKVSKKRNADKVVNKKVKKKWVPMRPRPVNGHIADDCSSDSVNSDIPPPPILEDLEEHLPNYHIANMKTERQVAAMTDTIDAIEEVIDPNDDVEEITVEPHVPVFIELSVGQDSTDVPLEQQNDCLMVVESVQCDIDPTLMLQARAEDEACCEQIDLDDEEDDDDVVVGEVTLTKKPVKAVDPISLLTSSDEDDVILQEPHIDTLSVSDETDEDDLPLQKLIKRDKKAKKHKKSENIKNVLVGVTDYYCTHCQHVSPSRSTHKKHLRSHRTEESSQATTKVYQICKECGFTTSSKSQLHRHQKKHLNDKRFKCPLCTYRSKYNMSLMYHLKTHDFDPNMYNCGACGLELDSKKALLEHQNTCSEMCEKFLCGVCGYVSKSKRTLKIHRNTVHKQKG